MQTQKRQWHQRSLAFLIGIAITLSSNVVSAQSISKILGGSDLTDAGVANRPMVLLAALAVFAMVPFILIMVTSFVKIAVVLSIVRQAIGTQQIPPTQVITGLATILTVYIMMPVGLEIYHQSQERMARYSKDKAKIMSFTVDQVIDLVREGQHPLRRFLIKHAHLKDRDMFYKLAWKMRAPQDRATLTDEDWAIIVPSFVISELKEAFQIGFILFVPFLVIDMVVANLLMALGMQMLSPTTISLPFKILLFVLVDGWYLISRGLVLGY
ncbi:MAG: type III secretion system export apparatus subunit SctR [Deltaproteobacteria bacterium]|nr:type III secretion system export apparatus subunit SctR [Deltaproteobacteria bacterium]